MSKLRRSQIDFLNEQTKNLPRGSFRETLNYYGLEVKHNSILCVMQDHQDTHFGSCMLSRNGEWAYCFVCHKRVDAIQIVKEKEGLNYVDAMERLWCDILHNPLPMAEEKTEKLPLSYDEMRFIGLDGCAGGETSLPYNVCDKSEDVPDIRHDRYQPDGTYLVAKTMIAPSISKLYKTNKKSALSIMYGAALEHLIQLKTLMDYLDTPGTYINRCVYDENSYNEYKSLIQENIEKTSSMIKKIRKACSAYGVKT